MDTDTVHDTTVSVVDGDPGGDFENKEGSIGMDTGSVHDTTVSVIDGDPGGDIEEKSNDNGTLESISSDKELIREVTSALMRLELDLACTSEKLVNMNLLMMHVAAKESDFEAFASGEEDTLVDAAVKGLEFDILSGIFDSEVREMSKFIDSLWREINNACDKISSGNVGDGFAALKERLRDAEESMKQSQEQVSELMMQSSKFQRILPGFNRVETSDGGKDVVILDEDDDDFLHATAKFKMQTPEQQRNILRMLEKSIARELELENQLTESTHALKEMKLRLHSSKQEVLSLEEETASVYARFLEADNASVIWMGISKQLIGQVQSCQLHINTAMQRESELNTRLQSYMQAVQRLEKEAVILQELADKNNSEALILKEKVNSLEEQLKASEDMLVTENASLSEQLKGLEEKLVITESRTEKAEGQSKLLAETNRRLHEELDILKGNGISSEEVNSLEKQLVETNIQLQLAEASVEASLEKQNMLNASISDMEILIENLKKKVSKADALADSAEDKCIILSEKNEELREELGFLRGKLECLEASLERSEETKLATAKDINIRSKMITDLVMQLAIERERLHNQIHLLMKENRALVDKLDAANEAASKAMNHEGGENEKGVFPPESRASSVGSGKGQQGAVSTSTEAEKSPEDVLAGECEPDSEDLKSKLETVRTIDPGRLSMKYVFAAVVTALIAVLLVCFLQPESCTR